MSFQIELTSSSSLPLPAKSIIEYFSTRDFFVVEPYGDVHFFHYEHPYTEVYFSFELEQDKLHFTLNYCRPSIFGLEAFPIVTDILRNFDLSIGNNEDAGVSKTPSAEELFSVWNNINRIEIFSDMVDVEDEKLLAFWNYGLHRGHQGSYLEDDYFLPRFFFLREKGKNEAFSAAVLPLPQPFIFPKVDIVCVRKEEAVYFVPFEKVKEILGKYLDDDDFIPGALLLKESMFFDLPEQEFEDWLEELKGLMEGLTDHSIAKQFQAVDFEHLRDNLTFQEPDPRYLEDF